MFVNSGYTCARLRSWPHSAF